MKNNSINTNTTASIKGVVGNTDIAEIRVCTHFFPIIDFTSSIKKGSDTEKEIKIHHFKDSDIYVEKHKPHVSVQQYKHLLVGTDYYVSLLKIEVQNEDGFSITIKCIAASGKNNCTLEGEVNIKIDSSIKGVSISSKTTDNVIIGEPFFVNLSIVKNIDLAQFEETDSCPLVFTVDNEGTETEVGRIHILLNLPIEQYVLVAGLDYPGRYNGYKLNGDFSTYVNRRKKEILSESTKNTIIHIYTVNLWKVIIEKDIIQYKKSKAKETKKYDPITIDNYNGSAKPYFQLADKKTIKKWDIYGIVEKIGDENPKTLKEFGIYSHAYYEGPILVDAISNNAEDDQDFRRSDIVVIEPSFEKAFSDDGVMMIWGCSFPKMLNLLFSRLRRNNKYKLTRIDDDEILHYEKGHFSVDSSVNNDPEYLVGMINRWLGTKFSNKDEIDLEFSQIKKIAILNYINSYAAKMAGGFDIKVISALPATYSNIDPNFHIANTTMENVNFYNKHLDVKLHNNYGIFDKETIDRFSSL